MTYICFEKRASPLPYRLWCQSQV